MRDDHTSQFLPLRHETDWALTFMLHRVIVNFVEDRMWEIVEVARNGDVLLRRDEPYPDAPGCALQRWFPGSVLAEPLRLKWER